MNPLVDKAALNAVIDSMLQYHHGGEDGDGQGRPPARNHVHLLNARDTTCWDYDPHHKQFVPGTRGAGVLGAASSKSSMFKRQYEIVRQRILRTEDFSGPDGAKLTSIRAVKGQRNEERRLLFGMLSMIEEEQVYLEDPEESIRLDFAFPAGHENLIPALYTETSMVVLGGSPQGDTFRVDFISPPPCEARLLSMSARSFSHPSNHPNEGEVEDVDLERRHQNESLLIASDVWLDCPRTMSKVGSLLQRCEHSQVIPASFVFMGPFQSRRLGATQSLAALARSFRELGEMISKCPTIVKRAKFVFVPLLEDPLGAGILPRLELPEELLAPLREEGIDCAMASNPCRLFFFSKEIVLFRHDLTSALRRNYLPQIPTGTGSVSALQTVLEQAHLCPLPLSVQPRVWEYDHSLTVYPQPHFLVVAEQSQPAKLEQDDCIGINPGSFATCECSFSIIYPLLGRVEACKV